MTNAALTHEKLLEIVPKRPEDYAPWGAVVRWASEDEAYPDCSMGCAFAAWLGGGLRFDWCVCTNPASHRTGLLTFEHQGCQAFEPEDAPPEWFADGFGEPE